jgi:sulfur-oxidizing protein SoxY
MTGSVIALTTVLPISVMAEWPRNAFQAKTVANAIEALFNSSEVTATEQILINAPEIAKEGAIVPIEVTANLPLVQSITLLVEKNPIPLIGKFTLAEDTQGYIKTRIKMAESSPLIVVVKADGKLYVARRQIEVVASGCI